MTNPVFPFFLKSRPFETGLFFCLRLDKEAPQVAFSTFIRCHGRGRSPLARKRWFTIAPVNTRYKYLCEAHLRVMGRSGGELGGPADEIVCRPCACARASRAYVRETLSSSGARFGPYSLSSYLIKNDEICKIIAFFCTNVKSLYICPCVSSRSLTFCLSPTPVVLVLKRDKQI